MMQVLRKVVVDDAGVALKIFSVKKAEASCGLPYVLTVNHDYLLLDVSDVQDFQSDKGRSILWAAYVFTRPHMLRHPRG